MNKKELEQILMERGWEPKSATLVADELLLLDDRLCPLLRGWITRHDFSGGFSVNGYSASRLMREFGLTYPAALLTLDWLIKEPEEALRELKRGIR